MWEPAIIGAVATPIVAVLAALFTYLGVRSKAKTDVQQSLNLGFNSLIEELQEERKLLTEERKSLSLLVSDQDKKIMVLQRRVDRLLSVTISFHNFIIAEGLVPPPFDNDLLSNDIGG
jgi:hypothetical protein